MGAIIVYSNNALVFEPRDECVEVHLGKQVFSDFLCRVVVLVIKYAVSGV